MCVIRMHATYFCKCHAWRVLDTHACVPQMPPAGVKAQQDVAWERRVLLQEVYASCCLCMYTNELSNGIGLERGGNSIGGAIKLQ